MASFGGVGLGGGGESEGFRTAFEGRSWLGSLGLERGVRREGWDARDVSCRPCVGRVLFVDGDAGVCCWKEEGERR